MDRARKSFSGGASASECFGERETRRFLVENIASKTCNQCAKWVSMFVGKISGLGNARVM